SSPLTSQPPRRDPPPPQVPGDVERRTKTPEREREQPSNQRETRNHHDSDRGNQIRIPFRPAKSPECPRPHQVRGSGKPDEHHDPYEDDAERYEQEQRDPDYRDHERNNGDHERVDDQDLRTQSDQARTDWFGRDARGNLLNRPAGDRRHDEREEDEHQH